MPDDTTPHGGEALHPLPDRATIPQTRGGPTAQPAPAGPRPPLPDEPLIRSRDLEEEDVRPAAGKDDGTSTGTGTGTGKPSVTRQPG